MVEHRDSCECNDSRYASRLCIVVPSVNMIGVTSSPGDMFPYFALGGILVLFQQTELAL
jgi:hypothetical protein